VAVYTHKNT